MTQEISFYRTRCQPAVGVTAAVDTLIVADCQMEKIVRQLPTAQNLHYFLIFVSLLVFPTACQAILYCVCGCFYCLCPSLLNHYNKLTFL